MKKEHLRSKWSILLVDDDRLILATLGKGLQRAGYDILEAASGAEALAIINKNKPDLAILDVRMPQMSGIELAKKLRDDTNIPFMFLSAYSEIEIAKQAAEYGAVGYLVKPIDTSEIIPAIESALARGAEIRNLRRNELDLTTALTASREVSIAVGLLIERNRMTRETAFESIRANARNRQRKINDVATELIDAVETLNLFQPELPHI
jgi:two-component system, response regulator PdtaR